LLLSFPILEDDYDRKMGWLENWQLEMNYIVFQAATGFWSCSWQVSP
jgi:hypothetical protein